MEIHPFHLEYSSELRTRLPPEEDANPLATRGSKRGGNAGERRGRLREEGVARNVKRISVGRGKGGKRGDFRCFIFDIPFISPVSWLRPEGRCRSVFAGPLARALFGCLRLVVVVPAGSAVRRPFLGQVQCASTTKGNGPSPVHSQQPPGASRWSSCLSSGVLVRWCNPRGSTTTDLMLQQRVQGRRQVQCLRENVPSSTRAPRVLS